MKAFRFVHLNVHSHYSINDGCASIKELVDAAIKDKMPGIAITDNGNMFGVMEFFDYVSRINNERRQMGKKPFKPIIGCGKTMDEFAKTDILQFRWLTSRKYMCELFSNAPEAIANTMNLPHSLI